MGKIRIYELSKELGIPSKDLLAFYAGAGVEAKTASSSVEDMDAQKARQRFGKAAPEVKQTPPPAPPKAAEPARPSAAALETSKGQSRQPVQERPSNPSPAGESARQKQQMPKRTVEENTVSEPQKKKNIIMVSNPHHSNMGQGNRPKQAQAGGNRPAQGGQRPQGQSGGGQKGQQPQGVRPQAQAGGSRPAQGGQGFRDRNGKNKAQSGVMVRPTIKPLTPPSPTPAVAMVPPKAPQVRPAEAPAAQDVKPVAVPAEEKRIAPQAAKPPVVSAAPVSQPVAEPERPTVHKQPVPAGIQGTGEFLPRIQKDVQPQRPAAAPRSGEGAQTAPRSARPESRGGQNVIQNTSQARPAQQGRPGEGRRNEAYGNRYGDNRGGQDGYNRAPGGQGGQGGYNRAGGGQGGQGGYNRSGGGQGGQGGYNRSGGSQGGQGGYNRSGGGQGGQGGYSRSGGSQGGQGGYNRAGGGQGGQGGYNRGPGQGGYNRSGAGQDGRPAFGQGGRPGFGQGGRPGAPGQGGRPGAAPGRGAAPALSGKDGDKKRFANKEKDKRNKKDHIYDTEDKLKNRPGRFIKPEKKAEAEEEAIKVIILPEKLTIKDLAEKMRMQPSAIVKKLFLSGKIVTVNQEISYEDAENIAMEYEILCEKEVKVDVIQELLKEEEDNQANMQTRPPVICVMGHVDHGKTSLLDAIRKTNVTDREAGGITQHIGAYTVKLGENRITFLDTPGHEAFTAMRMRGANATDIAILVVAADDGVMPQTVEAINHAKAAGIEILVAVNKIDKPAANVDRVKKELSEHGLIPEDWGGNTVFAQVSAKSGEGIPELLELILISADILELKADPKRRGRGLVIEAQLDKGRGPVATVLVQKGTLRVGDFISAGAAYGKVRAMIDDKGRRVKEAGPSAPVEILGLSDVPSAGEVFLAHDSDKTARNYAETYQAQNKEKMLEETKSRMSLDDLFSQIKDGNLKELNLIVKADVQGSVEAVKQSLLKLTNEEVVVKCIHGGVGAINESDIMLASASNAIIIGFNVRPDVMAKATAEREGVDIRLYKVIYQAIEDIEAAMKGMLDPIFEEKILGHAEVRQIFKASAIGNIAGSYVLDGVFQRGCKVRIRREGEEIFHGELASLKRFKDDVKEVKAGFECGLVFAGFDQMQELDIVEAYTMVEVPR